MNCALHQDLLQIILQKLVEYLVKDSASKSVSHPGPIWTNMGAGKKSFGACCGSYFFFPFCIFKKFSILDVVVFKWRKVCKWV